MANDREIFRWLREGTDPATVRKICARLDDIALDDPTHAIGLATQVLRRVAKAGPCARCEVYGARGAARRKLGDEKRVAKDFRDALAACSCEECFPRTRRRQAAFCVTRHETLLALQYAQEALRGFQEIADPVGIGKALAIRAIVYWQAGALSWAIIDARRSERLIPKNEGAAYLSTLQILACLLTYSGRPEDWREALKLLTAAENSLRALNCGPLRILKIKLRWVRELAEIQLGVGEKHAQSLHRIMRELVGLGVPVPRNLAERETERAEQAAKKAPLEIAAVAADMALVGCTPNKVAWAAEEAIKVQPEGSEIIAPLAELKSATRRRGVDVRPLALAVRMKCHGAPALPPCLEIAA